MLALSALRRSKQSKAAHHHPSMEPLDARLILDAPLALSSSGLVLADPTPEELLEPALFASPSSATKTDDSSSPVSATSAAPPTTDQSPDAIRVDLASATASSGSCCGSQGTFSIGVLKLGDITEGIPGETLTNYFKFFADGCGTPPASSVTISFGLGGTATINQDWNGPLTSGSTTITLTTSFPGSPNSHGEKLVAFTSIDDDADEPTETIAVTVNGASANTGATLITPVPLPPIEAMVTSGDWTVSILVGGSPANDTDLDLSNGPGGTPPDRRTISVKVTQDGQPQRNVRVTFRRLAPVDESDAKIVRDDGALVTELDGFTDNNGIAKFTIKGTAAPPGDPLGDTVKFTASATNLEGKVDQDTLTVYVRE